MDLERALEELGLNVARQPDNGSNPRPDNRVGWMEGETPDTPDVVESHLDSTPPADAIEVRLWDPSAQLRFKRKGHVPSRPDGAPNTAPAAGRGGRSIQ